MRIIAEREKIVAALDFVTGYADRRGNIPILECAKFTCGNDRVSVEATDLDKGARDTFDAHVDGEGCFCLDAALLLKAIKSTDATEIQIDAGDKEAQVRIGGKLKLKLSVLPAIDFPAMAFLNEETTCNFTLDANVFERHAKEIAFAISTEQARPSICGTHWSLHEGNLDLCATTGANLSLLSIPAPLKEMSPVIVPTTPLPEWEGEVQISVNENFIRFSSGRQIVGTKLIEGSYPDYRRILVDNPVRVSFDREDLQKSLGRMKLVSSKASPTVLIVGREGRATLSVSVGGQEVTDEIAYEGEDFQTTIVQSVIAPVIASFGCETIELRWLDHKTPISVHDPRDDSRLALVSPYSDVRILPYITSASAREAA